MRFRTRLLLAAIFVVQGGFHVFLQQITFTEEDLVVFVFAVFVFVAWEVALLAAHKLAARSFLRLLRKLVLTKQ